MEQIEKNSHPITVSFDGTNYQYHKTNQQWTVTMTKSMANLKNEQQLAVLKTPEQHFLPFTYETTEDQLAFHFIVDKLGFSAQEIQALDQIDKLKAAVNMLSFAELKDYPFTFFLHPENIYFDYNLIPSIAYRGIKEQMPPQEMNEAFLLRNMKCYFISLFQTEYSFNDLYDGNLENMSGNEFIARMKEATTIEELGTYVKKLYVEKTQAEKDQYQKVNKKTYQWSRQLSLWFGAGLAMALIALVYFVFFRSPFQNRLLEADAHFIQNNYTDVVTTLNAVDHTNLPVTQKYMLAYSVVQGQSFNDEQKKVILNNVSLKSDPSYLDYWVHIGQGRYEEALDVSKKIGDYDLILYGLVQIREQIVNNPELTGAEREEQLADYEGQYDEYTQEREAVLEEPEQE